MQKENLVLTLRNTELEEDLRISKNRYESEVADIMETAAAKIKRMRETFEADRCEFRIKVDKLQQQKVDLQSEIGQLLRDKRTTQSEFYSNRSTREIY